MANGPGYALIKRAEPLNRGTKTVFVSDIESWRWFVVRFYMKEPTGDYPDFLRSYTRPA